MKKTVLATLIAATAFNLFAENNESLINIYGDVRFDYQRDWLDGTTVKDNTGFKGRYLNLRVDGTITKDFHIPGDND